MASVANPATFDFHADWFGDRIVNPDHVRRNCVRLAALGAVGATHAPLAGPAGRQCVLPAFLKRFIEEQRDFRSLCRE